MISVIDPVKAATLFWRLAVLRRQLERAGTEIGLLSQMSRDEDLMCQLDEARRFVVQAVDYLTPDPEHSDCEVTKEA
jgi:hypothetical protein